jgi:3,4-dihydroxy 2-butanone 4-phosphate synthase/GTP cyclohydrolase II
MPKISVLAPRLQAAIEALQKGEMVILVDSEDRENEGDLVLAAQFATPEKINFLVRKACGLVCLALEAEQVDRLGLPLMVQDNQTERKTAFTVSIEASSGITTGISAQDRAHTIRVASDPRSSRKDVITPGHVFPLRAAPGGVLERAGHTEGSIELCKLAGLLPAAVICEIMNDDGTMARRSDLDQFSNKYNIPIISIEELIVFQAQEKSYLQESASAFLPSRYASTEGSSFRIRSFKNPFTLAEHAVVFTEHLGKAPLIRVHSECLTGDAFGSMRCDCGEQLQTAMHLISTHPDGGALIYLKNQEGRGIGFWNKMEAYALQDQGKNTLEANLELGFHADPRNYHEAATILKMMDIRSLKLLTNNPEKVRQLTNYGIEITERIPLEILARENNAKYLQSKRDQFNHWIGMGTS